MARSTADVDAAKPLMPMRAGLTSGAQSPRPGLEADTRLLLTVGEAAYRLGIGRSMLYELLADGRVESIHVGRLRRIPADALDDYVDRQRESARSSSA